MKYNAGAGLLIAGALITGLAFLALQPGSAADRKPDPLRVAAASLKHDYEITVTQANPAEPPGVSRLDALKIAKRQASFLGGEVEDAHLVYFTDPRFGKHRGGAKHRLTWIVLFRHATELSFWGPGVGIGSQTAGVAAFVDAKTGALITVITTKDLP